jgi:ligand-binding sensor domain-containing protein
MNEDRYSQLGITAAGRCIQDLLDCDRIFEELDRWQQIVEENEAAIRSALFEDREGTIWVGTTNGLDRFREPAVSTISGHQGLSSPAWSVLAARDGSIWVGTLNGLDRWNRGQMTVYLAPIQSKSPGEAKGAAREILDAGLFDNYIGSLFEDERGRIWVTSQKGVVWFENGRFTRVDGVPVGSANATLSGSSIKRRGVRPKSRRATGGSFSKHPAVDRAYDSVPTTRTRMKSTQLWHSTRCNRASLPFNENWNDRKGAEG